MHILPSNDKQKGQVLLLVVLASVIALTVGLAAISRSVTNTRISTEEANSQKALAAAEAGVEEQINAINKIIEEGGTLTDLNQTFEGSTLFNSEALEIDDEDFELEDGALISQDDGADVWIAPYPGLDDPNPGPRTANLNIYWKGNGSCDNTDPAIEIVVIENILGNLGMSRYAFDECGRSNFDDPRAAVSAKYAALGYNRAASISIAEGYVARIIPLYAGAYIAVDKTGGDDLPTQGYRIESTGESGDSVRKLRVYQGFPKLPVEFFPYNLFLP